MTFICLFGVVTLAFKIWIFVLRAWLTFPLILQFMFPSRPLLALSSVGQAFQSTTQFEGVLVQRKVPSLLHMTNCLILDYKAFSVIPS